MILAWSLPSWVTDVEQILIYKVAAMVTEIKYVKNLHIVDVNNWSVLLSLKRELKIKWRLVKGLGTAAYHACE